MKWTSMMVAAAMLCTCSAFAVVQGTDLWLPSVGRGQGSCPGGVCSQWRTDAWVFNPSVGETATVTVFFLARGESTPTLIAETVTVAPGSTAELADVMDSIFSLDGVFGALRFTSDHNVAVTGRIYDANVQTNLGVGTAGQFFAALPAAASIGLGESSQLIGLSQNADDGTWRCNFGVVETSSSPTSVEVVLWDGDGNGGETIWSRDLVPNQVQQVSLSSAAGAVGGNLRLEVRVTGGTGRVIAFASLIDNRTGDPSTVEMTTAALTGASTGTFAGIVRTTDGQRIDGGIELQITADGLLAFAGLAGIPCGDDIFSVDFFTAPTSPVAIDADGSFSTQLTVTYNDGAVPLFTINWQLDGQLAVDGVLSGTLTADVSDAVGGWVACEGSSQRSWSAGWISPVTR